MDDCACLYGGEGDTPEFYETRTARARTEHRCYECRHGIWPGDRYVCVTGKWDGEVASLRFCEGCWDVSRSLYCDDSIFGQLWEDVEEQLFANGGVTSACLDKLATMAGKRLLAERWWAWVQREADPHYYMRARRVGHTRALAGIGGGGLL